MHGKDNVAAFKWTFIDYFKVLGLTNLVCLLDTTGGSSDNTGVSIYPAAASGALTVAITRSVAGQRVAYLLSTTTYITVDGKFHQLALTYDQSLANANLKVYLDGTLMETVDKTANAPNDAVSTYAPVIGDVGGGGAPGNFIMAEAWIYKRVLTQIEIQNHGS